MIIAVLVINILVVSFLIIATVKISKMEDISPLFKYIPSIIGFVFTTYFFTKMREPQSEYVFQYFIQTVLYFFSSFISIIIAFINDFKKTR
jgi:hypothetical protein